MGKLFEAHAILKQESTVGKEAIKSSLLSKKPLFFSVYHDVWCLKSSFHACKLFDAFVTFDVFWRLLILLWGWIKRESPQGANFTTLCIFPIDYKDWLQVHKATRIVFIARSSFAGNWYVFFFSEFKFTYFKTDKRISIVSGFKCGIENETSFIAFLSAHNQLTLSHNLMKHLKRTHFEMLHLFFNKALSCLTYKNSSLIMHRS